MAHDSKLTLISDDFLQRDASNETLRDLTSLKQDDSFSMHSGTSVTSGEKEQKLPGIKESREETSKKSSISTEEYLTLPSKSDVSSVRSIEMSLPLLVAPSPSLQAVSSEESFQSLDKRPERSMDKVLGQKTTSILNKAELEASSLANKGASPTASEEDSPGKLHSLMNCRICQLFVRTVDRLLDKSEEMMDHYLPLTEEEINNLKLAVEELDASPADHQKSACLDRITALSSRLRQRAYMMALGKLRLARRSTHSNLSQLQQTLDLIEHAQQEAKPEFQKSHEKLADTCHQGSQQRQSSGEIPPHKQEKVLSVSSSWIVAESPLTVDGSSVESKMPRDGNTAEAGVSPLAVRRGMVKTGVPSSKDRSSNEVEMMFTVPGCREENGFPSTEVESKTLEMSRALTLNLQDTYENLLANLKDLPFNLKHKLCCTYWHMSELHARFLTAHSFADLPGSILEKSLQFMAQAQESMDEVMEFAFQNPLSAWAEDFPPVPVPVPATPLARQEEGNILKIQAAYDPKGCDENDQ